MTCSTMTSEEIVAALSALGPDALLKQHAPWSDAWQKDPACLALRLGRTALQLLEAVAVAEQESLHWERMCGEVEAEYKRRLRDVATPPPHEN